MLKPKWRGKLLLFLWMAFFCFNATLTLASHMIAVEIRAKPVDCQARRYEITLIAYVNTASSVAFGGGEQDTLSFGDGTSLLVPEQPATIIDPILNIGRVQYTVIHTYAASGYYILSYSEYARNEGIINMDESEFTTFYTETGITISSQHCDSSPYLTVPPVDRACSGIAYYHNPGATDPDDDSISFSFILPKSSTDKDVKNYRYPNHTQFYTSVGINYNQANENNNGPPTFVIDAADGTVTWDAPGSPGEYAFAIKITAWKFNETDSAWVESGFSIRDMQVLAEGCSNNKPELIVPDDICVTAGTAVQFTIPASDPDGDLVSIEAFSDVFSLANSPGKITPSGSPLQSTIAPNDTASVQFTWNTTCLHIKGQPYKIVFKVTDNPPGGPRLVQFKTVSIKVIAPVPEIESINVNPVSKSVTLAWSNYPCKNIQSFQVWRRVAEYVYDQPECNNGMPYFLRYTLLATLPGNVITYTDSDLSIGAQYCYRIVALVGENKIPSRISLDTCLIPKPAEAPVITNVSIIETHEMNGSIQVRWTSPFDIEKTQYPPPYAYKVYRSNGWENNTFTELTQDPISDTVFIDTPVNSQTFPYEYRIELFVPTLSTTPIDTSSIASSVFLTAESQRGQIKLTWDAQTPWSNYVQTFPFHLIYRSDQGLNGPFILIDSVDVIKSGFEYIDEGKFQNQRLVEDKFYYYKILSRGSYGNPSISQPLENYSQVVASAILDSKPPCTPTVVIDKMDCSNLPCDTDTYYNYISWSYSDNSCLEDGLTYQVFEADAEGDEFILLTTVSDNSFRHSNLTSLAKCYKVVAVDAAGNMSSQSEAVCNDNCPYFELPNVFTPGSEDGRNDQFIGFGPENGASRCARFVKQIDLKIYNRWGTEIYSTNKIVPKGGTFLWDGTSNTGRQLDSGVYYYSANVTFDVRNPAQQTKIIKGWVHLIRNK
ncbi:gliding motility-associated C-terminal domain-containing protein [Chryseolinea sp. H1M3-3]|uniref:T9SS type B sorting domain-containing protein n=1 Tax=Chryseolinea sp. H1M3-3 TaxID=3034144 RepID=UPI0023ED91AA|nr:gliding motility-associated C-terminal domain-containing protein [Chryseolinea sp. H1M3-3]